MKYIAKFLRNPTEFFKDERNQKILILSIFIFVFVCLLILLVRGASRRSDEAANNGVAAATSVSVTPTTMPTKWWIKMTATSSPVLSGRTTSAAPAGSPARNCSKRFSSPLKAEIYAYISLTPPLPNRVRSVAGLSSSYLGQLEPGSGLQVINGPVCADGYSWWLVESLHGGLRGWTVEGKNSEQWVVPCPNERVACNQTAVPTSPSVEITQDKNRDKRNCKSDKLSAGMFAQVGQDSLLVVRSEPATGKVIGRAGPMSIVNIVEGPTCTGDEVWWNVNVFELRLVGWATENNLIACPKDSECNLGQP